MGNTFLDLQGPATGSILYAQSFLGTGHLNGQFLCFNQEGRGRSSNLSEAK